MTKTKLSTRWGDAAVTVAADFAQPGAAIAGLEGLQVADVRHSPEEALRRAVDRCASDDGLQHADDCDTDHVGYDESCPRCIAVARAVDGAVRD